MSERRDRIEAKLKEIIVEHLGVEEDEVTADAHIVDDLGADSLDTVELMVAIEEAFGIEQIPEDDTENMERVKDVLRYLDERQDIKI